jgi:hypothetical protein
VTWQLKDQNGEDIRDGVTREQSKNTFPGNKQAHNNRGTVVSGVAYAGPAEVI